MSYPPTILLLVSYLPIFRRNSQVE
jgi:hypothetical protein